MLRFRSGRCRHVLLVLLAGLSLFIVTADFAQQPKKHGKKGAAGTPSASAPTQQPGSQIPLPVGQAAKGLVLPDIDQSGRIRSRFVAGEAKRVDNDHMELRDLQITTYTEDNQVDLQVAMADSVLDLNTHVLTSLQKTTIKRADFEIVGDRARFDTAARHGTMTGNVKMTITDASKLTSQKPQ